jgi:hypothetical protein
MPDLPCALQGQALREAQSTAQHVEGHERDLMLAWLAQAQDGPQENVPSARGPEGRLARPTESGSDEELAHRLAAAGAIQDARTRVRALEAVAPDLAALPRPDLARVWLREDDGMTLLHVLARRPRQDMLHDLQALSPVIAALGGSQAAADVFCAIWDVGRWWR